MSNENQKEVNNMKIEALKKEIEKTAIETKRTPLTVINTMQALYAASGVKKEIALKILYKLKNECLSVLTLKNKINRLEYIINNFWDKMPTKATKRINHLTHTIGILRNAYEDCK